MYSSCILFVNEEEKMTTPEILVKSSRSESAKRMWEKRKAKEQDGKLVFKQLKMWDYIKESSLVIIVAGLFIYMHHDNVNLGNRLDKHIEAINRRTDQIAADSNKRIDQLSSDTTKRIDEMHKEFCELIKEVNKKD